MWLCDGVAEASVSSRLVRKSRGVGSAVPIFGNLIPYFLLFTSPFAFACLGLLRVFVCHVLVMYS